MDKFWKISQQDCFAKEAKESLAKMLIMVHDLLRRLTGNGWNLPTFHNIMHMVSDMCKYGKPKEANTEVGEKNHKVFAKHIGRHCHKQHKSFANQVSNRLSDYFVINKLAIAMDLVIKCNNAEGKVLEAGPRDVIYGESTKMATHYMLSTSGNRPQVTWFTTTETSLLTFDENLAKFILSGYTVSLIYWSHLSLLHSIVMINPLFT